MVALPLLTFTFASASFKSPSPLFSSKVALPFYPRYPTCASYGMMPLCQIATLSSSGLKCEGLLTNMLVSSLITLVSDYHGVSNDFPHIMVFLSGIWSRFSGSFVLYVLQRNAKSNHINNRVI